MHGSVSGLLADELDEALVANVHPDVVDERAQDQHSTVISGDLTGARGTVWRDDRRCAPGYESRRSQ